jgi:Ca2+-binding EF-hand superfamily protein
MHVDLKDEEIDALFTRLDRNNDGEVTYDEFLT